MITLYRKNKLGVGTWRCWAKGATLYVAHAQVVGGSEIVHAEHVPKGLAGRTLEEQVASRVASRANRQRDKGYVDSEEEARTKPRTNALNKPHPMLAKKFADLRGWPGEGIVQPKLDGFRCLATRDDDGNVFCYTRGGKVLDALVHVNRALDRFLPDGVVLDGEIYEHGKPLQTVASLAKRLQPGTEKLVYHVYDCIEDGKFLERYDLASRVVSGARLFGEKSESVEMVPNERVTSVDEVWESFARFRSNGYEGAILRLLDHHYDSGSRSSGLLKVKAREDDEFQVLDVVEDANGCGVLVLKLDGPVSTFKTLAPGSHEQKRSVLLQKDRYIGRQVTVEYANLTKDGVPFHAVATRWKVVL